MSETPLRLMTWNINSVRKRKDMVGRMLNLYNPDILCLQEIKCQDHEFPFDDLKKTGLDHVAVHGQKAYHGLAILSRFALTGHPRQNFDKSGEARDLTVTINEGPLAGTDLHNLYVPAGGYIADEEKNPKFRQKLEFVAAMKRWGDTLKGDGKSRILVGDLNIAPLVSDVYSHEKLKNVVSHTPVERQGLTEAMSAGDWLDAVRLIIPEDQKLYSWWTYREKLWRDVDRGRRLDHIWISPPLSPHLKAVSIERELRGWDEPSDHVPVIADFHVS